jgi:hypothetical protein
MQFLTSLVELVRRLKHRLFACVEGIVYQGKRKENCRSVLEAMADYKTSSFGMERTDVWKSLKRQICFGSMSPLVEKHS